MPIEIVLGGAVILAAVTIFAAFIFGSNNED